MHGAERTDADSIARGVALRSIAVLLLSGLAALVKLAESRGAGLVEIMLWRQGGAVPVAIGWMILADRDLRALRSRAFGGQVLRAAVGSVGMAFNFGAAVLLALDQAATLAFTVPLFMTILGALVLREPIGRHRWGAVMVGFVGVSIVTRFGGGHFPVAGALVGLASSLFIALAAIQLRQIGRVDRPVTTVFWFSALSTIPLGLLYPFFARSHDPVTYAIFASMGLVGGLGQIAFTAALKHAPVSAIAPMDYTSLLWATLYGWMLFGALPSPWTWAGAPLIVVSGTYILWRERRSVRGTRGRD